MIMKEKDNKRCDKTIITEVGFTDNYIPPISPKPVRDGRRFRELMKKHCEPTGLTEPPDENPPIENESWNLI